MATHTVSVTVCRLCGAQYTAGASTYFAGQHFSSQHPGEAPAWRIRKETRETPLTITYLHGGRS